MTGASNRAERRRQKAQQRSRAKAGRQHFYEIHIARAGDARLPRVEKAVALWFSENLCHTVRCGSCDFVFFAGLGFSPSVLVVALPVLDPSEDGAGIAFCEGCARQTDDELEAAAAAAVRAAGKQIVRRLSPGAVHEGGRA